MSLLSDLQDWLLENPPADMPFYPGAATTGRVGFRSSQTVLAAGASPIHVGVDRSRRHGRLKMPFDGELIWRRVGGPAGSVLRLIAEHIELELQVFHTEADTPHTSVLDGRFRRDTWLPVYPSDLGLSVGIHTHAECLMPYDPEIEDWLTEGVDPIVYDDQVDREKVTEHCDHYELVDNAFMRSAEKQVRDWRIGAVWPERGAIRHQLPDYRQPRWEGETLIADTMHLLEI